MAAASAARTGRDRPEEQVGGVQRSFYALYEGRLLAEAILSGVAAALFLVFLGGLVLLQTAVLAALVSLRGSELDVQAQGSAWAARALFHLQEAVGQVALFPFAVFLAAAAVSAFVAVLAAGVGWPLATTAGRPEEAVR